MTYNDFNNKNKIATFIDLENVNKLDTIPFIFDYLEKNNFIPSPRKLIVSKINQEEKITKLIKDLCLELVVSFKRIKKGNSKRAKDSNKNNADFRYYIEVLETLYSQKDVNAFCIVTSDEDYTELILKLKSEGKYLIGVGNKEVTSEKYRALFHEFLFVDDLLVKEQNDNIPKKNESSQQIIKEDKIIENDKEETVESAQNTQNNQKKQSTKRNFKKAKEAANKKMISKFSIIAKEKINNLKPGRYNLSNITSEIKSENPKKFPVRISVELYEQLGYEVHIDNDDKSNAYIIIE